MSDPNDGKWREAIGCLRVLLFLVCIVAPHFFAAGFGPWATLGVSFGAILAWLHATPNIPGFDVYGDAGCFVCGNGILAVLMSMARFMID